MTRTPDNQSQQDPSRRGLASDAIDEAWTLYMDKPQREVRSSSGMGLFIGAIVLTLVAGTLWLPREMTEKILAAITVTTESLEQAVSTSNATDGTSTATETSAAKAPTSIRELIARPQQKRDTATPNTLAPTPKRTEAQAALASIVKPIADRKISNADANLVQSGIKNAKAKNVSGALRIAQQIEDPAARKLVIWAVAWYGSQKFGALETLEFAQKNPHWPRPDILRKRGEAALLLNDKDDGRAAALFKETPPISAAGKAVVARVLLRQGKTEEATKLVRDAWHTGKLSGRAEARIVADFAKVLTPKDHYLRVSYLLMQDARWKKDRRYRAVGIRRMFKHLSKADLKIAKARLSVFMKSRKTARKLMAKLPKDAINDPGVLYHKTQLARRSKRYGEAITLLAKAPRDETSMLSPDSWWEERRVNAYRALNTGDEKAAYKLVSQTGPVGVNGLNESRFMSGWIALRFLNNATKAVKHFEAMTQSADGPRTRGQSHYWLGRALMALGKTERAEKMFAIAAREDHTFYGQLAIQTLDPKADQLALKPTPQPSSEQVRDFGAHLAVRATVIAKQVGDTGIMRRLMSHLRKSLIEPEHFSLQAELAMQLGDIQMAVRAGKSAMARGFPLAEYAYPIGILPTYDPLRQPLEEAFLYSIARQESEFNPGIKSGAGARGILQVMPITARHICRQYKIKCKIKKLMSDPSYNAKIASAYIADRNSDYDGSYIMTMPGYNAGPGRVRGWVRQNGDPRNPSVDPIDWIERLHIKETREYTKKVLANIQVYRARLGTTRKSLQLWSDIMRARRGKAYPSAQRYAKTGAAG